MLETGNAAKFLPVQLLTQMIRLSDDSLAEFFSRYVTGALDVYLQAKRGVQSIASYNPLTQLPMAATDALTRMWMSSPFGAPSPFPPGYGGDAAPPPSPYPMGGPPGMPPNGAAPGPDSGYDDDELSQRSKRGSDGYDDGNAAPPRRPSRPAMDPADGRRPSRPMIDPAAQAQANAHAAQVQANAHAAQVQANAHAAQVHAAHAQAAQAAQAQAQADDVAAMRRELEELKQALRESLPKTRVPKRKT